jgi:tetraacyldisaccharide-1-P 4'-kinase
VIEDMDLGVLVLDDAMQHRAIKAGFNILMTDFNDPFFKDTFFLPETSENPEPEPKEQISSWSANVLMN